MTDLLQRAYDLLLHNKMQEASDIAKQLLNRDLQDHRNWELLRDINAKAYRHEQAIYSAQRVVEIRPDNVPSILVLARIQVNAGLKSEAVQTLLKASSPIPRNGTICDTIGALFSMCDEPERALAFSEAAVAAEPENALFTANLAMVQRMLGKFSESKTNFDAAIRLNPHDYRAYYSRSDLSTWTSNDNHISEMEALLTKDLRDWRGEVAIRFALAKEYDDLKDYENAFKYIKSACRLQRNNIRYDVQDDVNAIERIVSTYTKQRLSGLGTGFDSNEPIFVLGLPRTGTTLVERILSSHSDVYAAGELSNLGSQLDAAVRYTYGDKKFNKSEMIERSLGIDTKRMGQAYIESTRPRTGHTPRFIDKLPLNYLYCGLIHAILPNAKIILLQRNPMDACFAMYRTMFLGIYPFSYSLEDIGAYYLAYDRLVAHWQCMLGDSMLTVNYEDLVTDVETQTAALLNFCDLAWEPACAEFYLNAAPSTTASAVQVRRKIYTSSVSKWLKYEAQLEPLRKFLAEHQII